MPDFGRVFLILKYTDVTQILVSKLNGYGDNGQRMFGLLAGPRTVTLS